MFDICAIGELLVDFTMTGTDKLGLPVYTAYPGGAPANFVSAASKNGARTAIVSSVGSDFFGTFLIDYISKQGVYTHYIKKTSEAFTTQAFVTIDSTGNRSFDFARKPGADTLLNVIDLPVDAIKSSRLLHFGSLSLSHESARSATLEAIKIAKSANVLISFDPNIRLNLWPDINSYQETVLNVLDQVDILKISEEEIQFLWSLPVNKGIEHIHENYPVKIIFVTLGEKGAIISTKNIRQYVAPLISIEAQDTTGAGDIFGGTAISSLLKCNQSLDEISSEELLEITQYAATVASLSTLQSGGIPSIPSIQDVKAYLATEKHTYSKKQA